MISNWICHKLNSNLPPNIDYHLYGLSAAGCFLPPCVTAAQHRGSRFHLSTGGWANSHSGGGRASVICIYAGATRLLYYGRKNSDSIASCLLLLDYLLNFDWEWNMGCRAAGHTFELAANATCMLQTLERRGGSAGGDRFSPLVHM